MMKTMLGRAASSAGAVEAPAAVAQRSASARSIDRFVGIIRNSHRLRRR